MLATPIAAVKRWIVISPPSGGRDRTMRRATLTSVAAMILGAALAWWLWPAPRVPNSRPQVPRAASHVPGPQHPREPQSSDDLSSTRDTVGEAPVPAPTADYRTQFYSAGDYLDFTQQLLPAARGGDAAAQYYLYRALGYCESLYEWYFIERNREGRIRHRTLDEAQQITAFRPFFTPEEVSDIQAHCLRLRSLDDASFGSANQWFDAALAQGYPLAQAEAASRLAVSSSHREDSQKVRISRDEARRLAFESLRDGDIHSMIQVGDVDAFLAGEGTSEVSSRRNGWLLAAALRDGDSQEMQEWMLMACRIDTQCQPYETPADVVRRKSANNLDAVERRAREINEKLQSGTLTESDIG